MIVTGTAALTSNVHARRFVKFCIVGASSTFIQMSMLQAAVLAFGKTDSVVMAGNALGVFLAIINGFYWNRRWTFRQADTPGARRQFLRFLAVSVVGFGLNTALMYFLYVRMRLFHGNDFAHLIDQFITIGCVVLWNFTANSKWTFRDDPTLP